MVNRHSLLSSLGALSLSLSLLAGCASPTVPPAVTTEVAGTTPAPAASSAPATESPDAGQPAPAIATLSYTGKATFNGEALSGYTVQVQNARTNQPLPTAPGADGLAVISQSMLTDAQGGFSLQIAGLAAGQAVRVVVSKGSVTLETILVGDKALAAPKAGYAVLQAANQLNITEVSTALARIAGGVLITSRLLKPEAAASLLDKLYAELTAIATQLETTLAKNSGLAQELVTGTDLRALNVLVDQANLLKALTEQMAGLLAEMAKKAQDPANQAGDAGDLSNVEYGGTVLSGAFLNGTLQLSNAVTGRSVDAGSGDMGTVTDKVRQTHHNDRPNQGPLLSTPSILVQDGGPIDDQGVLRLTPQQLVGTTTRPYIAEMWDYNGGEPVGPPTNNQPMGAINFTLLPDFDGDGETALKASAPDFATYLSFPEIAKLFFFDSTNKLTRATDFSPLPVERWYVDPEEGANPSPVIRNPVVSFPTATQRYYYVDGYGGTHEFYFDENGLVGAILPTEGSYIIIQFAVG